MKPLSLITVDASEAPAILAKLEALEIGLNADLVERQTEIKTAIVAMVARRHHFQVGPPGVAKSLLVRRLVKRVDGLENEALFQWLLTKFTAPEEIFGPLSLKALEEDIIRRNTANKLPEAQFAFLDEIFKGSSSILNTLLTIMNERLFFNAGSATEVPLQCVFAASNELPHGEELNALWDRLHFRHEVRPVQDKSNFVRMISQQRDRNPEKAITWNEVLQAQQLVAQVKVPTDVYEAVMTLRENLRTQVGIEPSERRFVEALPIIQATAFLNGRDTADIDDMRLLRHVLWYKVEDQKAVTQQVLQLSNPIDKEANDLLEQIEILGTELDEAVKNSDNPKARAKAAVQIHAKLQKAKGEMESLKKRSEASGRKSEIMDTLTDRFVAIGKTLMRDCFQVEQDDSTP